MAEVKLTALIVEDEENIGNFMSAILKANGFKTILCTTGDQGIQCAESYCPDIILLDLGLPDMDGAKVLEAVRQWSVTPIVVISARNQESEKVRALDMGADDYITKPFGNQELLARIRTALRHRQQPMEAGTTTPVYCAKKLKIDFDKRRVFLKDEEIRLTQIEYKLVSLLAENAGRVITYEFIIKNIWGPHADNNNQILRVNMANIRRKIEENPAVPQYIYTEVGVGYRMLENELFSQMIK
ncbi:DNA-binding response regulator [Anaerostipes sp. 494a]|uniref:response regulator n=1 Tax=Anaerostipes sp. 494a TaxID=1261636 RepID=UPI000952DF0F|nr:response regulator transcription factor [Anaerostipes sp. 494a]OLR59658.1 DNA-binding response regulator [Anaerostipes sp. 494a]